MLTFTGGGIVPGVTRASPVASDSIVPDEADTVVIGGGIIGCMTALNLAERGMSVAVCEKGFIGGEASCRAAGLIEYQHLAPIKMELIVYFNLNLPANLQAEPLMICEVACLYLKTAKFGSVIQAH